MCVCVCLPVPVPVPVPVLYVQKQECKRLGICTAITHFAHRVTQTRNPSWRKPQTDNMNNMCDIVHRGITMWWYNTHTHVRTGLHAHTQTAVVIITNAVRKITVWPSGRAPCNCFQVYPHIHVYWYTSEDLHWYNAFQWVQWNRQEIWRKLFMSNLCVIVKYWVFLPL